MFAASRIEFLGHRVYFSRISDCKRTSSCDRVAGILKARIANSGARICEMTAKLHLRKLCRQERQARIVGISQCHALECGGGVIEACIEYCAFGHAQGLLDYSIKFSRDCSI